MTPPAGSVRRGSHEGVLRELKNAHNSVTVQNRTHVYINFFRHKDLGNHLLQLCPKVVKHPVCLLVYAERVLPLSLSLPFALSYRLKLAITSSHIL